MAAPAERNPLARHSLSPIELKQLLGIQRGGESYLAFRDGDEALTFYELSSARQHTLGRNPETDLALTWDREVSGLHAELRTLGGEWTLIDDGLSTNGTFVNGQRVAGRLRLRDGDLLRLGRTTLAYGTARAGEILATVSAGADFGLRAVTDTQHRVLVALCRPYREGSSFATPATNQQIAEEVFLSVDAVKTHLRVLFAKLELADLPQNQKRTRLAECALQFGLVAQRDLV